MSTKDLLYSRDHINTKYLYDITPYDNDRSLNETELDEIMKSDEQWLLSLDSAERCTIIYDLIRMSGSALAMIILKQVKIIKDRYEFIECLKNCFVNEENITKSDAFINSISEKYYIKKNVILKEISKNLNIEPLLDLYKVCSNIIEPNLEDNPRLIKRLNDVKDWETKWESDLYRLLLLCTNGEFDKEDINESAAFDQQDPMQLKSYNDFSANDVFTGEDELNQDQVDKLQLMPLNVIRLVLSYLDDDSKEALSNVDQFWKLLKMKLPGHSYTAKRKSMTASGSKSTIRISEKKPSSADTTIKDDLQEPIFSLIKRQPKSKNPFRGKYNGFIIETSSMYDRSIDCNRRLIASTENTSIVFYNLITGVQSNFTLDGHSLVITCLVFFPNSYRIATASADRTIRIWDLWHRTLLDTFTGHTDVILSISVNERYIVSCSRDETIRVLSLKLNTTLFVINETFLTPTKVLVTNTDWLYIVTTQGSLAKLSLNNRLISNIIEEAHEGCITFLSNFGPLIVTTGEDLYVRIWNENLLKEKCLVEIFHEKSVNSAVISYSTLITGCIDGYLRFWDLATRKLFRQILINYYFSPIISIKILSYYNHIKILCNNEAKIYVIQFLLKSFKLTKKSNPYQAIMLSPIYKSNQTAAIKINRLSKVNNKLCSSLLQLNENSKITKESIVKNSINDPRFIEQFPCYTGEPISEYDQLKPEIEFIEEVDDLLTKQHKLSTLSDTNSVMFRI
ncbi:hypothetical protein O3M35_011126 [Rhynocoris fuscipes]|uniref:Uncharacterized protein n=1 Tax=Rhynocoris fuscipes TaxID=488301 RepID=A0AAW1D1V9_9HEMI